MYLQTDPLCLSSTNAPRHLVHIAVIAHQRLYASNK